MNLNCDKRPLQLSNKTAISSDKHIINVCIDGEIVGFVYTPKDAEDMIKDISCVLAQELYKAEWVESRISVEGPHEILILTKHIGYLYNSGWEVEHRIHTLLSHQLVRHHKSVPIPPPLPKSTTHLSEISKIKKD